MHVKVRMRPHDGEERVIMVASNAPLEESFTCVINLNKAGLLSVCAKLVIDHDRPSLSIV